MATTETRKMVLAAAAVCEDKKADDTRVLELDPADSGFTDFFLITSGNNTRQTVAIADEIEMTMKRQFGTYANSVEGRRTGEWILMDYVDFVVHIFVEEKRAFYDIERLRKSARSVDVKELEAALTKKTAAVRKAHPRPAATTADADADTAETPAAPAKKAAAAAAKKAAGKKTAAPKKTAKKPLASRAAARPAAKATRKAPAKKSATREAAAAASSLGAPAKKATPRKSATPAKKSAAKRTKKNPDEA